MNATTLQNKLLNNNLFGVILLSKEELTINGQIKARENALKSCVKGREELSEGITAHIFDRWIESHKKALRELYFRRAVLTTKGS